MSNHPRKDQRRVLRKAASRTLPTVSVDANLRTALEELDARGMEIVLVTDPDTKLVGVLTDGDVRRALLRGIRLTDAVADAMNRQFVSVNPTERRAEVLDLMKARGLQQIPVLDGFRRVIGLHVLRELVGCAPRTNNAVIMAGGRGERLRPLTDSVPKPMLKVAGRPILERLVLHLVSYGIRTIYMAVHYKASAIKEHFKTGDNFGCDIRYLEEESPKGTAGAISVLAQATSEPLVVLNGDLLTNTDIGGLLDCHTEDRNDATIGLHKHSYTIPFGVIETNVQGRVVTITEKPTTTWAVNAGIYALEPEILSLVPSDVAFSMTDLLAACLAQGKRVGSYDVGDEWIDVGRPSELTKALGTQ